MMNSSVPGLQGVSSTTHFPYFVHTVLYCGSMFKPMGTELVFLLFLPSLDCVTERDLRYHAPERTYSLEKCTPNN